MKYGDRQESRYAKHVGTILTNSKRAVPIMSFYGHHRVSPDKPLVIVRSDRRPISINFEFESHSTAYSSVIIALLG